MICKQDIVFNMDDFLMCLLDIAKRFKPPDEEVRQ